LASEELFRQDAYLKTGQATVTAVDGTGIQLDRTIFYPRGGGQPGDIGTLTTTDGTAIEITDTLKGDGPDDIVHIPADGAPSLAVGATVSMAIDWDRRHVLMRMHTALHLLSSLVDGSVTGGQVGTEKSRLDFDLPDTSLDKQALTEALNQLIEADTPVSARWITDAELDAQPDLVKTMSVAPPRGAGRVRLIEVDGVDLQACGGTHVARTGEIGPVTIGKIENKGRHNRRINIRLDAPANQ
jgi:misacylated tRNA(Ala) deacylase